MFKLKHLSDGCSIIRHLNNDWTTIKDFPMYEADSSGYIRNKKTKHILSFGFTVSHRYYTVALMVNGYRTKKSVHRLIIQTFKPIEDDYKYVVDHIDNNRFNNNINNLRWVTAKVNQNKEFGHKLIQIKDGKEIQFDCAADCARANGIVPDTLNWHIRNHGEYNRRGIVIKVVKYGKYCRSGKRVCP